MKKVLIIGMVLLLGLSGHAQDLLVKRNGQRIYAVVMNINKKKVIYQRWGYPYSPLESVKTKALWGIRFENGRMVRFDHLWKDDDDDDRYEHHHHNHHHNHDGYYHDCDDDDDDRYEHHHHKHHHDHDGYYYYCDDDDDDDREEMIEEFLEEMEKYGNPVKRAKKAMEDWEDWLEDRMEDDDD